MEFEQTKRHIVKLSELLKKGEDPVEVLGDKGVDMAENRDWIRPRPRVVEDDARTSPRTDPD